MVSWLRHRYGGPTWRRIHSTKSYQPSPPGRTITARPMEQHPRGTFTHNPSTWFTPARQQSHFRRYIARWHPDSSPVTAQSSLLDSFSWWQCTGYTKHHPIASLPTRPVGATEGICWDTNGRNYYEVAERSSSSSPASVHIYNRV